MNLLEVRQQFRVLSGRYDLVNSDGSDNGADFFIRNGQKWLDRKIDHKKSDGRVFKVVESGAYGHTFQYARAIEEVWMAKVDENEGRWQLTKKSIQDLRLAYADLPGNLDTGDPLYWAPGVFRSVTETGTLSSADFSAYSGYADVIAGDLFDYNGVLWMPPTDGQMLLEVWGKFYTEPLADDTDENYWSVNYEDVLIMAALRHVEVFNRNTQGRQDWESAISDALMDLDKDVVLEDQAEVDQMEG